MTETIENLLKNSHLPGPRSNLELLYHFAKNAQESEINECLSFYNKEISNSPEEFAVCCGIVGYCILKQNDLYEVIKYIRKFTSHSSWRIREAVAMGIQEIAECRENEIINLLEEWINGNALEKRTVVAALCEPKLLKSKDIAESVLDILYRLILNFQDINSSLTEEEKVLRKALGYGLSVAMVSNPEKGKKVFEEIAVINNKNIRWIVKENLKKNRLVFMDREWVANMRTKLEV